jgi:hypothetical protein
MGEGGLMATPTELCERLNAKWLAHYGAGSMSGNCGKLACMLREALIKHGYKGWIASGVVEDFEGNHAWVVCDGQILDPSVNQFGDYAITNNGLTYHEQRRMEFLL